MTTDLRSMVCTDEVPAYKGIAPEYIHESVNHKNGQYVDGVAHTNGMESIWTIIKQSIHGTYHAVGRGHMQLYLNEISFRMNEGKSSHSILESIDSLLEFSIGLVVNYKMITDLSYSKLQDSNSSRQWERLTLDDMNFCLWAILDRVDERMAEK